MLICDYNCYLTFLGMMPLFLWVGNPFCGCPCIPLRLLIVMPGGLVVMVMTFTAPMGVAKNGLLSFAPSGKNFEDNFS